MSIKPSQGPVNSISVSAFTPQTGYAQQNNVSSYALAPYPIQNPPTLIGVDCVTQEITGTQSITFPNLPIRGTANPLQTTGNQPQQLTINPGDTLMFEVSVHGAPEFANLQSLAVDTNNTSHPGPFLGAGTYKQFLASVQTTGATNITVWGKLYLQRAGTP